MLIDIIRVHTLPVCCPKEFDFKVFIKKLMGDEDIDFDDLKMKLDECKLTN